MGLFLLANISLDLVNEITMASSPSGKVSASPGGLILSYIDDGSYGTITSRTLNVYDAYGNLFQGPFIMGTNLTQTVNISADQYLAFVCVIVDNLGTYTVTVNYLAEGIAIASFLDLMAQSGCGCQPNKFCNIWKAQANIAAAEWLSIPGLGVAANTSIQDANTYLNAV